MKYNVIRASSNGHTTYKVGDVLRPTFISVNVQYAPRKKIFVFVQVSSRVCTGTKCI